MKSALLVISGLILAAICISACPAAVVALAEKETTPTSLAETGAKEAGEHVAKGYLSPTATPTPGAGQQAASPFAHSSVE